MRNLLLLMPSDSTAEPWYRLANEGEIDTPALVVYPDRIAANIRRMIEIAGAPTRLWPHVKTHKMSAIVRMQIDQGIRQFKCATLAEAEMAAGARAAAVLVAQQLTGPKVERFVLLATRFPQVRWLTIVDDFGAAERLSAAAEAAGRRIAALVDLDVGMGRTGTTPSDAATLYRRASELPGVRPVGLHAYDGHLHQSDVAERERACDDALAPVLSLREQLRREGHAVEHLITGGSPTFAIHARHADRALSPGTCVLWDAGYAARLHDLPFEPAAVVIGRVISKPRPGRICLDLGHKAVSPDSPDPRAVWLNLPDAVTVTHNEEHWAIDTPTANSLRVGDVVYGVPWHICPTCALHRTANVARDGRIVDQWPVDARDR